MFGKVPRSRFISFNSVWQHVPTSVDFNDDTCAVACEICKIGSDRCLPSKMNSRTGDPFQMLPKLSFHIRHRTTKVSGTWSSWIISWHLHSPHP